MDDRIAALIHYAKAKGASDLHLEAGLAPAIRVKGNLQVSGDPISANALLDMTKGIAPERKWAVFLERNSCDFSKYISGVRCRVNVLKTVRGVGMAIRLLAHSEPTLTRLNLHPDLLRVVKRPHGLVLFSGPTGCGKSSTMAALIQELNLREVLHVITIESPIEYDLKPRLCYLRQREVGTDTPSFHQGLLDSLREDPDLVMIGEMRDPETMRVTLDAAETGRLVFATVHSATVVDALQRLVASFPYNFQDTIRATLADCLAAVVCQRMTYRRRERLRVPELEILISNDPAKAVLRQGNFRKIGDIIQTGVDDHMWTFQRYRNWLDRKEDWHLPWTEDDGKHLPEDLPEAFEELSQSQVMNDKRESSTKRPTATPSTIEIEAAEDLESLMDELDKT